jgi:hypothetical protein
MLYNRVRYEGCTEQIITAPANGYTENVVAAVPNQHVS